MKNTWFKGARSAEAKATRRADVLAAKPVLEILSRHIQDRIQDKQRTRDSQEHHSEFQYSVQQAQAAGEIRALREISALLNIKEEHDV